MAFGATGPFNDFEVAINRGTAVLDFGADGHFNDFEDAINR